MHQLGSMELTYDDAKAHGNGIAGPAEDVAANRETGSVAILLCTFNGARFLPLQLASF